MLHGPTFSIWNRPRELALVVVAKHSHGETDLFQVYNAVYRITSSPRFSEHRQNQPSQNNGYAYDRQQLNESKPRLFCLKRFGHHNHTSPTLARSGGSLRHLPLRLECEPVLLPTA